MVFFSRQKKKHYKYEKCIQMNFFSFFLTMTSRRLQTKSTRSLCIIDSQTRARYANQREANKLRRKLIDIDEQHTNTLARLTYKQHNIKTKLLEIQHEITRRGLEQDIDDGKNILTFFFFLFLN